jgi:SAM-dependent MidA family methyltransferase
VVAAFDYADSTTSMANRDPGEWLRTYRGHERGERPLMRLGEQDITCEVAIDQLPKPTRVERQAAWLRRHGIDELVDEGKRVWEERKHLGDLEAVRARSRINEAAALTDPTGLGAFTVLEWS